MMLALLSISSLFDRSGRSRLGSLLGRLSTGERLLAVILPIVCVNFSRDCVSAEEIDIRVGEDIGTALADHLTPFFISCLIVIIVCVEGHFTPAARVSVLCARERRRCAVFIQHLSCDQADLAWFVY